MSRFDQKMTYETGLTQTEDRLRYLERYIDAATPRITPRHNVHIRE